jgi:predicted transposase YdaD
MQLLATDKSCSAELGKALLRAAETETEYERRLNLIETILVNEFPESTKEIIMQMLDLEKIDITQSRFYQEIILEGRQEEGASLVLRRLGRRLEILSESRFERLRACRCPNWRI